MMYNMEISMFAKDEKDVESMTLMARGRSYKGSFSFICQGKDAKELYDMLINDTSYFISDNGDSICESFEELKKMQEKLEAAAKVEETRYCRDCVFAKTLLTLEPCNTCLNDEDKPAFVSKEEEGTSCMDCYYHNSNPFTLPCSTCSRANSHFVPKEMMEKRKKEEEFDSVAKPSHYTAGRKYEPRKVIEDWGLDWNLGNTVKYISRAGRKVNTIEDLEKARQYLSWEIEAMEREEKDDH